MDVPYWQGIIVSCQLYKPIWVIVHRTSTMFRTVNNFRRESNRFSCDYWDWIMSRYNPIYYIIKAYHYCHWSILYTKSEKRLINHHLRVTMSWNDHLPQTWYQHLPFSFSTFPFVPFTPSWTPSFSPSLYSSIPPNLINIVF